MGHDLEGVIYSMSREEEEKQTEALAKKLSLPHVNLINYPILADVLYKISEKDATAYSLVAYLKAGEKLMVATFEPQKPGQLEYLKKLQTSTNMQIILNVCSKTSFRYVMQLYKIYPKSAKTTSGLEVSKEEEQKFKVEIKNLIDLKDKISHVSTTNLLDVIFAGASATDASDIHLEPEEKEFVIRYRIDGVLQRIASLPLQSYKALVSRIKFMSKLKIDVTSVPQDGRFDALAGGRKLDVRVSTLPTAYGEAIVMRLLYEKAKFINLTDLGFSEEQLKIIHEAISKPHGIIFNTGPTGSGKTTTLYAILKELNKPGVKIITLEDPIEYRLTGIDQSQVDARKGYTFAKGLRSVLRHDPDIIMVGEIRDLETAEIAIQAAMTGHLVLTTLHTNNATGAYPRLLDMGIKPYLLGGAINLIIAQRLVRKLCQKCGGKGCTECNNTGYHGRMVITELLVPTPEIEILVRKQASLREFQQAAKAAGMISMEEDGMMKVRKGITSREEILRVTRE